MLAKLIARLRFTKKHKQLIIEYTDLLQEIVKVTTLEGCYKGYIGIGDFAKKLEGTKHPEYLREQCGKLIEYLTDTKEHIQNGYHKPRHNGWKVKRE